MANGGREIAAAYLALVPSARGIRSNLESELRGPARQAGQTAGREIEDGITAGTQSAGRKAAGLLASTLGSAAIVKGLRASIDAASNLEQAIGGTEAVFGEAAATIDAFAESSADAFGISNRSARELTSGLGQLLQGLGLTRQEAADTSVQIASLGADLSAAFGGRPEEAVQALGAAFRGEYDPIERYVGGLTAATVAARAVEMGLATSTSKVDSYAKAQATLAIILEQTASIQGQSAREADTAAGQQVRAAAKTEEAAASLGDVLLPVYAKVAESVGFLAENFAKLPEAVQYGVVALGGIVAIAGPVTRTIDLYRTLRPAAAQAAAGLADAGSAAQNSAASVQDLYAGSSRASRAMGLLGKAGVALAAVGIAKTLYDIASAANQVTVDVQTAVETATDELVRQFEQMQDLDWGLDMEDAFRQIAEGGEAGYQAAIDLRDGLAAAGHETEAYDAILAEVAESQALANDRATKGADALNGVAGGASNAAGALEDVAIEGLEAEDILDALNDQLDTGISLFRDYFDAASSDEESMIRFRDVLRDIAGMQDDVNEGNLKGQERVDAFAESILKGRDVILDLAEGWAESGVPLEEISTRMNELTDDLFEGADQAGLTKKEVRELREEFGLMPEQIAVAIETNLRQVYEDQLAWNEAIAAALQLQEQMRVRRIESQVAIADTRLRAKGGPVAQGETVVVGEEGPELVRFDRAAFVTPNDIFEELPRGITETRSEVNTINVYNPISEDPEDSVLRALRRKNALAGV